MSEPLIDRRSETEPGAAHRYALHKDTEHGMIAGVCAGLGDHLNLDPTLIRAFFIGSLVFGGFGAALYLALWVLMDKPPPIAAMPHRPVDQLFLDVDVDVDVDEPEEEER